jgi:hypothetical protein
MIQVLSKHYNVFIVKKNHGKKKMAIAQQAQQPNRIPSKPKKNNFAHTANTKYGTGDNYGTGVRQKLGKVREDYLGNVNLDSKKLKTPPRNLA